MLLGSSIITDNGPKIEFGLNKILQNITGILIKIWTNCTLSRRRKNIAEETRPTKAFPLTARYKPRPDP